MPKEIEDKLQQALKDTTTDPPTHHVFKYASEEVKKTNADTIDICPDFPSANASLYLEDWSSIPQHSDDEPLFNSFPVSPHNYKGIMSVSLGATRIFGFKCKATSDEYHIALDNGDVLFMEGSCQETCTHQLLPPPSNYQNMPKLENYPKY